MEGFQDYGKSKQIDSLIQFRSKFAGEKYYKQAVPSGFKIVLHSFLTRWGRRPDNPVVIRTGQAVLLLCKSVVKKL